MFQRAVTRLRLWLARRHLRRAPRYPYGFRPLAVSRLGEIKHPGAVDTLMAVIAPRSWEDAETQGEAAVTLGKCGDTRAIDPLTALLDHYDCGVTQAAAAALEKLGWHPGNDTHGASYAIARQDWPAVPGFGAAAVGRLIELFRYDTPTDVAAAATEALVRIGTPAVGPCVGRLGGQHTRGIERVLVRLGAASVDPLIRIVQGSGLAGGAVDKAVDKAVRVLGAIGDARAAEPLAAALASTCEGETRQTVSALGRVLRRSASAVPSPVLRSIAAMANVSHVEYHLESCGRVRESSGVDCSRLRQSARQELIRRGEDA